MRTVRDNSFRPKQGPGKRTGDIVSTVGCATAQVGAMILFGAAAVFWQAETGAIHSAQELP